MKPDDHKRITRKTVQIFNQYNQSDFSSTLLLNSERVESGATKEDVFPVYNRITNWHFFKQNQQLQPTTVYYLGIIPLPVIPTSEVILARRIAQLKYIDGPVYLGELVGRILHHIQDMSTPAHVVPVYHGPWLQDSFENYSVSRSASELETIDIDAQEYAAICSEDANDIMSIYTKAAEETLRYLYAVPTNGLTIGNNEKYGWELFWRRCIDNHDNCTTLPYAKVSGFGCYGPLGDKYGATTVELDGVKRQIDPAAYRDMHRWVLHKQIADGLRTLIAIEALMQLE
jgi:hypothetical protein